MARAAGSSAGGGAGGSAVGVCAPTGQAAGAAQKTQAAPRIPFPPTPPPGARAAGDARRPGRLRGPAGPPLRAPPALAFAPAAGLSLPARGEPAKWDQEKVAGLAKQLNDAANTLSPTFYKQPPPQAG